MTAVTMTDAELAKLEAVTKRRTEATLRNNQRREAEFMAHARMYEHVVSKEREA